MECSASRKGLFSRPDPSGGVQKGAKFRPLFSGQKARQVAIGFVENLGYANWLRSVTACRPKGKFRQACASVSCVAQSCHPGSEGIAGNRQAFKVA